MIKKIVLSIVIIALVYLVYVFIDIKPILLPNKYFEYENSYKQFVIHSDKKINEDVLNTFDEVIQRLEGIALPKENYNYEIYICNDPNLYKFFADIIKKSPQSQGFNVGLLDKTFINTKFIESVKSQNKNNYKYNILEGNKAHIITHEIVHELINKDVGSFESRNIDPWKTEGLCEYYASLSFMQNDSLYSFYNSVDKYLNGYYNNITQGRKFYIYSKLLVEYLIDIKGKTYFEIINNELNDKLVLDEINYWYNNKDGNL